MEIAISDDGDTFSTFRDRLVIRIVADSLRKSQSGILISAWDAKYREVEGMRYLDAVMGPLITAP